MQTKEPIIIDVREPFEYSDNHVDGAVNLPSGDFLDDKVIEELRKKYDDTEIILYCRTGARAGRCQKILEDAGFLNVKNGINQHTVEKLRGQI